MLQPINFDQNYTNQIKSPSEYIKYFEVDSPSLTGIDQEQRIKKGEIEQSQEQQDLPKHTESPDLIPEGSSTFSGLSHAHYFRVPKQYTDAFVQHNTSKVISSIISEIDIWIEGNTEQALPNIAEIKIILQKNKEYLISKPHHRQLYGALSLLFHNNNWENVEKNTLEHLKRILSRFQTEAEVSFNSIQKFIKEVGNSNIVLLHEGYPDEEIKKRQKST